MSSAGVIVYVIGNDGSLDGRWTHPDLKGRLADERAFGGTPGKVPGLYSVDIHTPDGQKVFEGSLTITELDNTFSLIWSGTQLLPRRRAARYSGIGMKIGSEKLIATFQEANSYAPRSTLREVWESVPGPNGERFAEGFTHGSLRVLLYAPRGTDTQQPHEQDEVYIVMKGSGSFIVGDEKRPFAEGDVLFAPSRVAHRFDEFTDDLIVWVVFYGPSGGESEIDARTEIEKANADFATAYRKKNPKAVADLYTPSAKLLPPHGQIVEGRDAIEQFWKAVMFSGIESVQLSTTEVQSFGDTAVEMGAATLCNAEGEIADSGKYLVEWKRIENAWRLHRDCWNSNNPLK